MSGDEALPDADPRAPGHLSRDAMPPELGVDQGAIRDVGVVVVAGGKGARSGSSELKQFRWIAGKPMLLHSIQAFQRRADVALVVAVLPRTHAGDPPPWIFQCDLDRLLVSAGGRTRGDSVWNGLEDMPDEVEIVVIHDAARPLVSAATIDAVIAEARRGHGAIAALPVVDALKRVNERGEIVTSIDRSGLWRAQTPQAFPRDLIEHAYQDARRAGVILDDDAAVLERMQLPVVVVRGSERAMKVTEEPDFARAELLFRLGD